MITRPREQAQDLANQLISLGATVKLHPVIEIRPPEDWLEVDQTLGRLGEFGLIAFVSSNGVECMLDRCAELGFNTEDFGHLKIAAIGTRTADLLKQRGLDVSLVPSRSDSEGLAKCLIDNASGEKMLLVRANRGSSEITERLIQANVLVEQVAVYQSVDLEAADPEVPRAVAAGEFDWVTITSSAIAVAAVKLFGGRLRESRLVSISPTTSRQLEKLGMNVAAEAKQFNMDGLVAAIVYYESR